MNPLPASLLHDLRGVDNFNEAQFVAAHNKPPVVSVRLNSAKDIGLFKDNKHVPWCNNGVYLPERPVFTLDPAYHAGAYYVQEASSMFTGYLLQQVIGDDPIRVLDLCAAPGGKSTLIASIISEDSLLISNDVIRSRATILDENITRWGHTNAWVTSNDPRDFGRLLGYFDVAVIDAPCSGSGLFRKDARALEEWSEANVKLCSERQQRILADIWPSIKDDGYILYATCSYSPQEDEQILDWLADNYSVTTVEVDPDPSWGIVTVRSGRGLAGYRFFPDKVDGEGFFIACLQKKDAADSIDLHKWKSTNDKKILQQASYLLRDGEYAFLATGKDEYSAMRIAHEKDWHMLQKALYFRKAGIRLGSPAGKDWLPAHDTALSIDANPALPRIEVTREAALKFLSREDMGLQDAPRGWQVITYMGLGLGWVKSLGNRVNNYLPKHWRIRMEIPDLD